MLETSGLGPSPCTSLIFSPFGHKATLRAPAVSLCSPSQPSANQDQAAPPQALSFAQGKARFVMSQIPWDRSGFRLGAAGPLGDPGCHTSCAGARSTASFGLWCLQAAALPALGSCQARPCSPRWPGPPFLQRPASACRLGAVGGRGEQLPRSTAGAWHEHGLRCARRCLRSGGTLTAGRTGCSATFRWDLLRGCVLRALTLPRP